MRNRLIYVQEGIKKEPRSGALFGLVDYVREKGHETCVFDGFGELSLISGGRSGRAARRDFAVRRNKSGEQFDIFVIDVRDFIFCKIANLFARSYFFVTHCLSFLEW